MRGLQLAVGIVFGIVAALVLAWSALGALFAWGAIGETGMHRQFVILLFVAIGALLVLVWAIWITITAARARMP